MQCNHAHVACKWLCRLASYAMLCVFGETPATPTCGDGQVRLVDGVDADVVDLVDADDVAVAADQGQHAQQRPRQQAPVDVLRGARTRLSAVEWLG